MSDAQARWLSWLKDIVMRANRNDRTNEGTTVSESHLLETATAISDAIDIRTHASAAKNSPEDWKLIIKQALSQRAPHIFLHFGYNTEQISAILWRLPDPVRPPEKSTALQMVIEWSGVRSQAATTLARVKEFILPKATLSLLWSRPTLVPVVTPQKVMLNLVALGSVPPSSFSLLERLSDIIKSRYKSRTLEIVSKSVSIHPELGSDGTMTMESFNQQVKDCAMTSDCVVMLATFTLLTSRTQDNTVKDILKQYAKQLQSLPHDQSAPVFLLPLFSTLPIPVFHADTKVLFPSSSPAIVHDQVKGVAVAELHTLQVSDHDICGTSHNAEQFESMSKRIVNYLTSKAAVAEMLRPD